MFFFRYHDYLLDIQLYFLCRVSCSTHNSWAWLGAGRKCRHIVLRNDTKKQHKWVRPRGKWQAFCHPTTQILILAPSPPCASGWHTCVGRCKFKFLSPTGFQKLRSCWRWGLKPDFSGNHYVRQPELISLGRGRDNWLPGPGRKWINKCAALVTFETIQSTWWPQQLKLKSQEEREVRGQPLKLSKILWHTFGPSLFYLVGYRTEDPFFNPWWINWAGRSSGNRNSWL